MKLDRFHSNVLHVVKKSLPVVSESSAMQRWETSVWRELADETSWLLCWASWGAAL